MRFRTIALGAGLLVACSQKKPDPSQKYEPAAKTAQVVALDGSITVAPTIVADAGVTAAFEGTVRGIVKLAHGAKLPIAPPVLSHGATPPSIQPCPEVDINDQRTVTLAKETGGLSPIHVALTGMRAVPPLEPRTHDLFIDACRLRPTLLGVRRGDMVRVTNRSEMALVPQLPGAPFMRGLLRGESQQFEAKQTQNKVQCSFGSYCGETLVIATTHSLYDVTTNEGFFTIEKVPLDQPITVHAWHPLFEENSVKLTLTKHKPEQMVEIVLTPAPSKDAVPGGNGVSKPVKKR
jgi:hypothetical protein